VSILLPENAVSVIRGSSKTLNLTVKDKHGEPVDLTGSTLYFTVKRKETDRDCLIQKISTDSAQIEIASPATQGTAQIFLQPSDTTIDPGKYRFDIWVVLASGARFVVVPPSVFEVKVGVTVLAP
jgi:hypothetical protein